MDDSKESAMGRKKIDWVTTLVPVGMVIVLCVMFFLMPDQSNIVLGRIRFFLGDTLGSFYLVTGLGFFILSIYIACSKYGNIILGEKDEKPRYTFWAWGSMMFTCGLAADILFYSFSEWFMYAVDPYMYELGSPEEWAGVFSLFHWSLIPWAFYLVLAVAFGFMLHVRKRNRQKFSEACRPLLGNQTDSWGGRIVDLLAVFALLAGTATTFSVATPLMSQIFNCLLGTNLNDTIVTICILVVTCIVYTYSLLHGFRGISILAKICMYLFFGLLAYVFFFGGEAKFIVENGISSLGRMIQNFIELATATDPQRRTSFPQNWTIYYWAYWMVWCVAAPFFIGNISRGRTVKQTILGGYIFGVCSTILSFIILGNYSLGKQTKGSADFLSKYINTGDVYELITDIVRTIPCESFVLVLLFVIMIAFYATSFDSIAYTAACYSYYKLDNNEQPHKLIQFLWCILLILLPVALVFAHSSMNKLQSVSIIAAFPIAFVIVMIVWSFMKDAKRYMNNN